MTVGRDVQTRDRGAAAVEFALVVPVLLLIVFGIIDFGRLLNAQLQVSEAAREGARASSTIMGTSGQRAAAAEDRISYFSSSTVSSVQFDSGASTFCGRTPGDGSVNKVAATYQFHFITPVGDIGALFGGGRWGAPITVRATSVMPCRS
jgi:Flp pilus assembly protein TadG